ncbi:hypothetical protein ACUNV4_22465 [Granulosicoccus sp. 3-233]|uniref:hypothetical protein n=1 Tax=Granulosicoccus sp. 3-233 TaxID=3417969 RepID=UPI003D34AC17
MSVSNANTGFSIPFDIMVGVWTGHSIMYDEKGQYLYTGPSLCAIYWKTPGKLLHYWQNDLGNLDEVLAHPARSDLRNVVVIRDFDLLVDGKSCQSVKTRPAVSGVESIPGTYLFDLALEGGHYYNNQYFHSPNERHIIGPYVKDGDTGISAVVAQTFTRISYDVPQHYRSMPGVGKASEAIAREHEKASEPA